MASTSSDQQPVPGSFTKIFGNRQYTLKVIQQPQRARMCGFGDKDRRPITPPPCVRLFVTDPKTGNEIDYNDVAHSMLVLMVDLWSEDGTQEVNLVQSTSSSSSALSTARLAAFTEGAPTLQSLLSRQPPSNGVSGYAHPPSAPQPPYGPANGVNGPVSGYSSANSYPTPPSRYLQHNGYGPPNGYPPHPPNGYGQSGSFNPPGAYPPPTPPYPTSPEYGAQQSAYGTPAAYPASDVMASSNGNTTSAQQPQGMFQRNMIGSTAASAARLMDTEDRPGLWFVLQDLSVRTEGVFRLRFSFMNLNPADMSAGVEGRDINTGRAPKLASAFSDPFTVYSAKKFPGVCDTTSLSKCFASQGIKIPIRKEADRNGSNANDDDD